MVRNFAISFFGNIDQKVIVNAASQAEFGLPPPTEPDLTCFSLDDAFEDGEADLFRLLRWDYGLVETLYGRDEDLGAILNWAESGSYAATARLVTGEGGAGKTRLAAEAALCLRDKGWTAGFLPRNETFLFNVGECGLFLILDYPEEQMERTRALFAKLAELKKAPYPIRLLLLSRRPFEAWEREADRLEGRFGRQSLAAPGLLDVADGIGLIAEATARLAGKIGRAQPELSPATRWLSQHPAHRLPLFATAAAIHAVLAPKKAFELGDTRLLHDLARRERRRVLAASRAFGLGEDGLERLLALAVLADGLSESTIQDLINAGAVNARNADVLDVLGRSAWWSDGQLVRLQPDRPAAAFIDLALFPPGFPKGRDKLPDWLFTALRERATTFGDRLGSIQYDLASLHRVQPGMHPLDQCLVDMIRRDPSRAAFFTAVAYQEPSHWSASFTAEVAMTLADRSEDSETRAELLNNTAAYLSQFDRREEALQRAGEATRLYRELARTHSEAFTPNLALSLNNLADRLSDLSRHKEALRCAEEASALHRKLERKRPDDFTLGLANSLNSLATTLSNLERREEALQRAGEATGLYRKLVQAQPETFTSYLANSFNHLANTLSDLDRDKRDKQALRCAEKATDLYRDLARERPESYIPGLAMSLNTLGNRLSKLRRREEALQHAEEATGLYRELARARRETFTPYLAGSLHNLAARLSEAELDRRGEALQCAEEATDLYRELVRERPEVFIPDLAMSLNNLVIILNKLDLYDRALAAAGEAVRALAPFRYSQRPPAFAHWMATMIFAYRDCCEAAGKEPDAELLQSMGVRFRGA